MSADYSRLPRRAYTEHLLPGFIELLNQAEKRQAEVADLSDEVRLKLQRAKDDLLKSRHHPPLVTMETAVPPGLACFLLDLFLKKTDRPAWDDLEEEFTTYWLPKYGGRRARFWFWKQTVKTIAYRNAVCRWVLVSGLVRFAEWILRQISS